MTRLVRRHARGRTVRQSVGLRVARGRLKVTQTWHAAWMRLVDVREKLLFDLHTGPLGPRIAAVTGRTPVHVFGDSHARVFRHMRSMVDGLTFTTHVYVGATAYGLGNSRSETGSRAKIIEALRRVPEADPVLLQFGEVDCAVLCWRKAELEQCDVDRVAERGRSRYQDFIDVLGRRPVLVCGVTPAIVDDYTRGLPSTNPRYGLGATREERNDLTKEWNLRIRSWSEEMGHVYVDLFTPAVRPGGTELRAEVVPTDPKDHHLDPKGFARCLAPTLRTAWSQFQHLRARAGEAPIEDGDHLEIEAMASNGSVGPFGER